MNTSFDQTWFMPIRKIENPPLIIICFPYGGGGASKFWFWKKLKIQADIWSLKLPGRESRISESLITSPAVIIDNIIKSLPSKFTVPCIFYGHSMGAALAFQTILKLQEQGKFLPILLIVSGREAPHFKSENMISQLKDEMIIKYIQNLGGVSKEISMSQDFVEQYLPKIRADYILNDNIPIKKPFPLPIHVHVINGNEDDLIREELLSEWGRHTLYPFTSTMLKGGHFFMEEHPQEFLYEIEKKINSCLKNEIMK